MFYSKEDFINIKRRVLKKRFSHMNPMQAQAVFNVNGPLLILAGAGSGKTTVIINRIAYMIKFGDAYNNDYIPSNANIEVFKSYLDGENIPDEVLAENMGVFSVRPWNILAITFTNKAANELKERLSLMLGEEANDVQASTFHSACVRILRRDIERLGYSKSFTIYDADDSLRVIKDVIGDLKIDDKKFKPKSVLGEISNAKDSMVSPNEYMASAGSDFRKQQIARIYVNYQLRLRQANAVDFDDIICKTVELFEENPDVLEYYQNRFKYLLVDEYQDTNHAQYRLVSLLADKHQNICVVGDDDQSIYKFRGATIENILSFENQFKDAKVISLEQNYRSTQTILDAANEVIKNNVGRKGKNLWTENGEGDKISLIRVNDERAEAKLIADTIEDNVADGMKYSDHAVLYRMNSQSGVIERYFIKSGIPYKIFGGLKFFQRKEVKDIVAYLSVISNPNDTIRLKRIINEPKRSIGDATIMAIEQIAFQTKTPVFEVLRNADSYGVLARKATVLMQFANMIEKLRDIALNEPLDVLLDNILEETGYRTMLLDLGKEGEVRIENVEELKSTIMSYEQANPEEATLQGFLEEIALYTDLDNLNSSDDCVVLMTMHSAKGLEFPVVFLPGMEDGIFPSEKSLYDPLEIEEERRLAYVSITRAKKKLYFSHANERRIFDATKQYSISKFVKEIPDNKLEKADETMSFASFTSYSGNTFQKPVTPISKPVASVGTKEKVQTVSIDFSVGDRVRHKVFGEGTVLSITNMGNDNLIETAFDKIGTKKIMANFAKLVKI